MAVTADVLILLFAGDEYTQPWPTDTLAERICEHVQPSSVTVLKNRIYGPEWPNNDITLEERDCMAHGYTNWTTHGRKGPT